EGAFIGAVHRHAAQLDGQYDLVCGAFSSDAQRSLKSGLSLGVSEGRCYADFKTMCEREAELPEHERMQCVVIVTPNYLHCPIAIAALGNGFHVLSDKPATVSLAEAQDISQLLKSTGLLYGLTHPYTGYPVVREARERVTS